MDVIRELLILEDTICKYCYDWRMPEIPESILKVPCQQVVMSKEFIEFHEQVLTFLSGADVMTF